MSALLGLVYVACVVLALAGAQKLADPTSTMGALRAQGLPSSRVAVRVLALVEVATGAFALVIGSALAFAAVAAFYLAFAVFVIVALHTNKPLASCGCFGRDDTPPTPTHVVVNLILAAACIGSIPAAAAIDTVMGDQPAAGLPLLGFVALGVALVWLALSVLPATEQAARKVRG